MALVTVGNVREALGLMPLEVLDESLGIGDGSTKNFATKQRPIVDCDGDGVIKDDVFVKVDGTPVEVDAVIPDVGIITLKTAPDKDAEVTAKYYWSPVSDNEIGKAIASAVSDAEAETAMSIEEVKDDVWEDVLYDGDTILLPDYPITKVSKVEVEGAETTDYTFDEYGNLTLTNYMAGEPIAPYWEPTQYKVKVTYDHGWTSATVPGNVYNFILCSAKLTCLRALDRKLAITPEYQETVLIEFKEKNLGPRIGDLEAEVKGLKEKLPKAVELV